MTCDWYVEGTTADDVQVVECDTCGCTLGVDDARGWKLEHQPDDSHVALTVEFSIVLDQ